MSPKAKLKKPDAEVEEPLLPPQPDGAHDAEVPDAEPESAPEPITPTAEAVTAETPTEARMLRNMTPDRLVITSHDGQSMVFAPLESRALEPPERDWPWTGLLQAELLAWRQSPKAAALDESLIGVGFWVAAGLVLGGFWLADAFPEHKGVVWLGVAAFAVILFVVTAALVRAGRAAVTRQTAQILMLVLVVMVSLGLPLATVWRFTEEDPWAGDSLAVAARILQVMFITLAAMLPGLLFFFFDRQRLTTLRDRFAQQIFRLDPNVSTLSDVQARYGSQMEEVFTVQDDKDATRLARQRRWPILMGTVALALGWVITLMPLGTLSPPAGPADLAETFAPQQNHVAFGFLGAYFFSLNLVLRRYARGDLRPKTYSTIAVRIVVVIILAWLIDAVATDPRPWTLLVAFLVGVVPETALTFLREIYRDKVVARALSEIEETQPLQQLEGLDLYDRARLLDEGVANVESLAHHDLIDLLLETRIPAGRLVDWVDQSILYLHLVPPSGPGKASGKDARDRLRALGVRTATDLEAAAHYAREGNPAVLAQLNAAIAGAGKDSKDSGKLDLLLVCLGDDEWMPYVRSWRQRALLFERKIRLDQRGVITQDRRVELER